GHVTVAGRETALLPAKETFEVTREGAVIELPGGARIELSPATRAAIHRGSEGYVLELTSGTGDFGAPGRNAPLRVETALGGVSASEGRLSLELMTTLPDHVTAQQPIEVPRLKVVVALGQVTVKRGGELTILSAGEERVFLRPT